MLIANIEVFAWTPYEMPKIDPNFIQHELTVLPEARSVKQRGKIFAIEHVDTIVEEVEKLKNAYNLSLRTFSGHLT